MAELRYFRRSRSNWTPASYSADETAQIIPVAAGDLIGPHYGLMRTAFDGTGGRTMSLGDGGDVDRFMTTTIGDLSQAAGTYLIGVGGSGSTYAAIGRHLYTAADTIDIVFVAATGGSPTAGAVDIWLYIAKVRGN